MNETWRMKILYVENHAVFAKQVTAQFLSTHEVTIVPSLLEARQFSSKEGVDLVLVDYDLDDGKGEELVLEIRNQFPSLAIIGVSSHDEGNQKMLKAGANAVCSKMDFENIGAIIARAVPPNMR
jgi:DNA-binding response OmpR family regulator